MASLEAHSSGRVTLINRAVSLVAVLLLILLPANAGAQHAVKGNKLGQVRVVINGLTVRPPQGKSTDGHPKTPVYGRYFLRTKANQRASIRFRDGTVVKLNQRTDVVLRDTHTTIVRAGEVDQFDAKPGSKHVVRTASAVASAIGTNFDVRVSGKKTVFIVSSGSITVKGARGKVKVKADQATTVLPGKAPAKPVHVDAAAATAWTSPLAGGDWQIVAAPPKLVSPRRVATDSAGNVYVSDRNKARIVKVSPGGAILKTWPVVNRENQEDAVPEGLALDAQGNVYVADPGWGTIQKFTGDGKFLTEFGRVPNAAFKAPGTFDGPDDVALDSAGNMYVADGAFCRIQKLSPTGKPLAVWGGDACDAAPGHFAQVDGVAVDAAGNIYASDPNNSRMVKLDPSGKQLKVWGLQGPIKSSSHYYPGDIALDAHGNVFVATSGNYVLQKFDPNGRLLTTWGDVLTNSPATFLGPSGVAVDPAGTVYIVDQTYLRKLVGGGR
jgi:sugar lactone lactonase YvrE